MRHDPKRFVEPVSVLAPIRVLIVSIHPDYRAGLTRLVDAHRDLELVAALDSDAECLEVAQRVKPSVVILDTARTGRDGLECLRDLPAHTSEPRFLLVATDDHRLYVDRALRAGVHGYLLKHTASHSLVDAIRALATGCGFIDPAIDREGL